MMALSKVDPHSWGEAGNEHNMLLGCRLLSCLLAIAGGSTCLLSKDVYAAFPDRKVDRRTDRQQ